VTLEKQVDQKKEEPMNLRSVFSTIAILLVAWAAPSMAQQKLGDLVASGGYEWIIGKWVATADDGQKVECSFEWALAKNVVLNYTRMGGFEYRGLILLSPTGEQAFDEGADNRGGTWKGAWSPGSAGLAHRVEHTSADGQTRKGEIVYSKVDADTITIAIYAADSSGARNAEPWNKLTYKRQPTNVAPTSAAAETAGRSTDYQKLGDVVAQEGYEWMIGKWVAREGDQTYELEYMPILDKHAAIADIRVGDFQYVGMITYVASRQEIADFGADNRGGTWKGVWEQDGRDAVNKNEYTKSDGTTQRFQHVYTKIGDDGVKVKLYDVGASGSRASEPRAEVTFKRQKPASQAK
jgi:hypothetical protein